MWKLMIRRIVFILLAIVFLDPRFALSAQEKRTALVIGNGDYKSAPLKNPVNDATDVANTLNKLGFNVTLKTNVDQRDMEESIRDFGKELRKGGVGLFYYAGHGLQSKGRNYLIPIGADIRTEADVKYEAVDAGRVLSQMEDAENGLNIIILDACRDNPFERSFRSSDRGLARMDAPTGSILAYSTAPGSVAADGTDRNGLYTSMLLKHIMTPGLEIGKLFRQVRIDVVKASNEMQIPWETSSLMGDFYFNTKRGINVEARSETNSESPAKETLKYAALHPADTNAYKLAIFPSNTSANNDAWNGYMHERVYLSAITAIDNFVSKEPKIAFTSSYYAGYSPNDKEIAKRLNVKIIDTLFDEEALSKLWIKKSFFGSYEPDITTIKKYARKINVDVVVMYRYGWDRLGQAPVHVYLIDTKTDKVYIASEVGGPGGTITRLTNKVLGDFLKKSSGG